jgi:hypothetical protein
MGSRSSQLRRVDEFEAAVVGFGRSLAEQRTSGRLAHRLATRRALEALRRPMPADDVDSRRLRAVEDVDFHLRHIDRLLDSLASGAGEGPDTAPVLAALALALETFERRDVGRLGRLDRVVGEILDGAERPLLEGGTLPTAPDARLRRVALHVLAVGDAARFAAPSERPRSATPAA